MLPARSGRYGCRSGFSRGMPGALCSAWAVVFLVMLASVAPAQAASSLAGDTNVESTADSNVPGQAQAWPFTASASGTSAAIVVYVDSGNSASTGKVGLYSNSNGNPGTLLASGSSTLGGSGWNTIPVGGASVTAGTKYWLALLGTGGTIAFRDSGAGTCSSQGSSQTSLSSLPSSWSAGPTWASCPASLYVTGTGAGSSPGNTAKPPTASFTDSPSSPQTGSPVTFDASRSTCNAAPCSYAWEDDGPDGSGGTNWPLGNGQKIQFTFQGTGTKYVRVKVTDANARTGTVEHDVVVTNPPPSAPSNTGPPVVSGTAVQGNTLNVSTGTWTNSPTSYAYQWQDCAASGCTSISGATSSSYTLQGSDVGDTIDAVVTARNAAGSASATSAKTAAVTAPPPRAPSNTGAPVISGTATQGNTLTVSNGTWTNSPTSYTYRWQDCTASGCANISGATSSSYTLQASDVGDTIDAVVTATNGGGSAAATSARTATVTASGGTGGGGGGSGASQELNCFAQPGNCGYPDYFYGNTFGSYSGPTSFTAADNAWSDTTGVNPSGKTGAGVGPVCDSYLQSHGVSCTLGTAVACSALPNTSNGGGFSNTTLEGYQFKGDLSLGANVTLKNDCLNVAGGTQVSFNNGSNDVIEDSVLTTPGYASQYADTNVCACSESGLTLLHDALLNATESIQYHPFTLIDSYVLGSGNTSSGAHHENTYINNDYAGQTDAFEHSTLLEPYWDSGGAIFGDNTTSNSACFDSVDMEYNLIAGGNGDIMICGKSNSTSVQSGTTFTFINNNFARCLTSPGSGTSGTCTGNCPLSTSSEPSGICQGQTDRAGGFDTHGYYPFGGLTGAVDLGGTGFAPSGTNGGLCPGSSNRYHTATTWSGNVWDDISNTSQQGDRTNGTAVPCSGGL